MGKKKFKFHVHNNAFFQLDWQGGPSKTAGLAAFLGRKIFNFLFAVGSGVLTGLKFLISLFRHIHFRLRLQNLETKRTWAQRMVKLLHPDFSQSLAVLLVVIGVSVLGFIGLSAATTAFEIKNNILNSASLGSKYLQQAKQDAISQSFSKADNNFLLAYNSFHQGQNQLKAVESMTGKLINIFPKKQKADHFLNAAKTIAQVGAESIKFYEDFGNLKITPQGIGTGGPSGETITKLRDNIFSISQKLNYAQKEFSYLEPGDVPENYRETFIQSKQQLDILSKTFTSSRELFDLLANIFLGKKHILLLFENNNELRPTGGFMGTFGSLSLRDGQIEKITISSIYDLDGQLTEKITPPGPVKYVNDRWYLRDSNWFVDFPTSAKKITSFYEKEGGETPDLLLAITPNLIVDWLKIVGPIKMPHYGVSLNSDNFVELIQAISTISDDSPTNSPKQILADFVPAFLQQLGSLPAEQWQVVLQALQNNLNSKQVLLYSKHSDIQKQLEEFAWTGKIAETDRDYLAIYSANLSATKTDLNVSQQISLKSTIGEDGVATNELTLTRTNLSPNLPLMENESFIRILVPAGSTLISNSGFDSRPLPQNQLAGSKTDPDVFEWEKNSVLEVVSGITIGQEAGKTFFGNWINLKPGETRVVKLAYRLPYKLEKVDRYSLVVQKQPGSLEQKFSFSLSFPQRNIAWQNFRLDSLNGSTLKAESTINKDEIFGLVLVKQ